MLFGFGRNKKNAVFALISARGDLIQPTEYVIEGDQVNIGRDAGAHIVIALKDTSREHAVITRDGDAFTLHDVGSRNGTYVNGVRISGKHTLAHGDEIGFGNAEAAVVFVDKVRTEVARATLRYDERKHRFYFGDREIAVTGDQAVFLKLLFDNRGSVCDRNAIARALWNRPWDKLQDTDALDKLSSRVRLALRDASPAAADLLVTHRGVGYELREI